MKILMLQVDGKRQRRSQNSFFSLVNGAKDNLTEVSNVSGSSVSDFSDVSNELRRFHEASKTTISKEMVPVQPQSTANSPHNPLTTAAESQDQTTTAKTPPYKFPDSNNYPKVKNLQLDLIMYLYP